MSSSERAAEWAFNIDDLSQRIRRKLGEGIETRIFRGENVMLSVARLEPNSAGEMHSHPEEQWGMLLDGECTRIQNGAEIKCEGVTSGTHPQTSCTEFERAISQRRWSTFSAHRAPVTRPVARDSAIEALVPHLRIHRLQIAHAACTAAASSRAIVVIPKSWRIA